LSQAHAHSDRLFQAVSHAQSQLHTFKTALGKTVTELSRSKRTLAQVKRDQDGIGERLVEELRPLFQTRVKSLQDANRNGRKSLLAKLEKESALRRKYFNQVQELKGNIRVYCRVRPILEKETKSRGGCGECLTYTKGEGTLTLTQDTRVKTFEFEQIFKPSSTQPQVFAEVSDLVLSVLDG